MANSIQEVADILIAEAQPVLRENAVTARRVTTEWSADAAQKNQRIDIPIPSPIVAQDIVDPLAPPAPSDIEPFVVPVVLDKWKIAGFQISDREFMEMMPGIFPVQAEEALKALINAVDKDILLTAKESPYYSLISATPVWADVTALHKVLFNNLVPLRAGDVSVFVNGTAQAWMLGMQEFIHADKTGETGALRDASLAMRLNMEFFANQNVGTHTNGAAVTTWTVNGAHAAVSGDEQVIAYNAAAGDGSVGDIINIAGSGLHAIVSVTAGSNLMTVRPALRADVADLAAITFATGLAAAATYDLNYAFHRRAIAFASRPLQSVETAGTVIRSVSDPLSGISLRLEIRRVGKVNRYEWDILYGKKLVRPELTARFADVA